MRESFVIVGGSTWEKEEEILIEFIKKFQKKYIIAPHELNRLGRLQKNTNGIMLSKATLKKYSQLKCFNN